MNIEEYKKYVKNIGKNIENKLGKDSEELDFFTNLVKTFDEVCEERNKLEQALDEIEKYINNFPEIEYFSAERIKGKYLSGKLIPVDDLLQIIKKAKGE